MEKEQFIQAVEHTLLTYVQIESEDPYEPIRVIYVPERWQCIGTGNYAAVFSHELQPDWVVKVYARDYEGIEKEAGVYRRLGTHPAYSQLIAQGETYLVLKRLYGMTLYEAIHRGKRIPKRVIEDVEQALAYARKQGLQPHDVHGKNVMMQHGRGYVVDVSDFYKEGEDEKWRDLVKAYKRIYLPFLYYYPIKVPHFVLNWVRRMYRFYRRRKTCKRVSYPHKETKQL